MSREEVGKPAEPVVLRDQAPKLYPIRQAGKIGFIDRTGKLVIPAKFDYDLFWGGTADAGQGLFAGAFSDGMARIKVHDGVSPRTAYPIYRHGYIDATGEVVIPPRYEEAEDFSEGLAAVKVSTWREGHPTTLDRYGYIDKAGRVAIPARFYAAGRFSEGLADACEEWAGCGYINHAGRMVITLPEGLTAASEFRDGLATVYVLATGNYGFIDKAGRLVYEGRFGSYPMYSEGLVLEFAGGRRGLMDGAGRMAAEVTHPSAYYFHEGLALIEQDGKVGYVDLSGRVVIKPQYEEAGRFSEGLAPVRVGRKWGYIDQAGRMVIKPRFREGAYGFSGGLAQVWPTYAWMGYIDRTGKYVWRPSS